MNAPARRAALSLIGALGLLAASGCARRPATADDCAAIFDRIFALEFKESGFRDPALAQRKHDQFARLLAPYLDECRGARLAAGAIDCLAKAQTVEELSHDCLR
jgi:hypothetical protein